MAKKTIGYTQEHIDYLREITKDQPNKEITKMFNKRFNLNKSEGAITNTRVKHNIQTTYRHRWQKGEDSWNKGTIGISKENSGSFKRGNIPSNRVEIGEEKTLKNGYVKIKVVDGKLNDNWVFKHRKVYKEHYGEIPLGHLIMFVDGDKKNFDKDNLLAVTRNELKELNGLSNKTMTREMMLAQLKVFKIDIKLRDIEFGKSLDMKDKCRVFELRQGSKVIQTGTIKEIAAKCGVAEGSIKTYGSNYYWKRCKSKNSRKLYYKEGDKND